MFEAANADRQTIARTRFRSAAAAVSAAETAGLPSPAALPSDAAASPRAASGGVFLFDDLGNMVVGPADAGAKAEGGAVLYGTFVDGAFVKADSLSHVSAKAPPSALPGISPSRGGIGSFGRRTSPEVSTRRYDGLFYTSQDDADDALAAMADRHRRATRRHDVALVTLVAGLALLCAYAGFALGGAAAIGG